ncbi:MAG TPA: hypothetical protein VLV83_06450, partial [Acidobacteriota bacterium]|nr:hypothetical protein [Acidobacteriota bacterium]
FRRLGPEGSRTSELSASPGSSQSKLGFFGRAYALTSVVEEQEGAFDIELQLIGPGIDSGNELALEALTQVAMTQVPDAASQPCLVAGAGRLLVLWAQDGSTADDLQVHGRILSDPPAPASELSFEPGGTVDITPGGLLQPSTLHDFQRTSQIHLMDDDVPVTRLLQADRGSVDLSSVNLGETLYQTDFSLTIEMGGVSMEAASGRIEYRVRAKSGSTAIMDGIMAEFAADPMILALVPGQFQDISSELLDTTVAWASLLPGEGDGMVLGETFRLPLQLHVDEDYRIVQPELNLTDSFLKSFYRTPSSGGPLEIISSVLSLRGRSESSISLNLQVEGEPPPPELTESLHFAQFGGGGGLASQLILSNPADAATVVQLEMFDQDGDPLLLPVNGMETDGTLQADLPAGGVRIFQTVEEGELLFGSLTVRSEHPIGGVVLFGGLFGLAGVGSSQPLDSFQVPVEVQGLTRRTGLAIRNLASQEVQLDLTLTDQDGAPQAAAQLDLAPFGQDSRFTDEIEWDAMIDFSNFLGQIIVTTSEGQVAATAIQVRPNQFASLPVIPRPSP